MHNFKYKILCYNIIQMSHFIQTTPPVENGEKAKVVDKHLNEVKEDHKFYVEDVITEKDHVYRYLTKLYVRLVQNAISSFSSKNTLFDLCVRNEAEFALLSNYRLKCYNDKLKTVKRFYNKIVS